MHDNDTIPLERSVFLCGYRGSGKTSAALQLASLLNCSWVDTDDLIEAKAAQSIADIFAQQGESGFRDIESDVIQSVTGQSPQVVALGGGAVLRESNRQRIKASGNVFWLSAPATVLAARISGDIATGSRRPSLTGRGVEEEVREVLSQREPIYREASHHTIDVSTRSPDEVAQEIIRTLGLEPG